MQQTGIVGVQGQELGLNLWTGKTWGNVSFLNCTITGLMQLVHFENSSPQFGLDTIRWSRRAGWMVVGTALWMQRGKVEFFGIFHPFLLRLVPVLTAGHSKHILRRGRGGRGRRGRSEGIPVSSYVFSGCVPRHAIIWVPALNQGMTDKGIAWPPNHTLITWQLANKWLLQKNKRKRGRTSCHPSPTGTCCCLQPCIFTCWMWITTGAADMPEAAFFAKFAVVVELLVLNTNWLISISLMQLTEGWTPYMFAWPEWAAVGCMVQALTMDTPIFKAAL